VAWGETLKGRKGKTNRLEEFQKHTIPFIPFARRGSLSDEIIWEGGAMGWTCKFCRDKCQMRSALVS